MKISIGANVVEGPWGGGNLFFKNFIKYFSNLGNTVVNDLLDDDIDIILLTDPRSDSDSSSFTHKEIKKYLKYINNNAIVVQRINECDERKSTIGLNKFYMEANKIADHTVFVSSWIFNIYKNLGISEETTSVFLGGGDSKIFNSKNRKKWDGKEKIKLVTHHWSSNKNKGIDVYKKLDELLEKKHLSKLLDFTYVGNLSKDIKLKNTNLIQPMYGESLSDELKKYHIYITASMNEPSGNHHIEAAQTGLPILYIDSGGITEYCNGYGIIYNFKNLEEKILELIENYNFYFEKLLNYPFNNESLFSQYENLFEKLNQDKEIILRKRNIKPNKSLIKKEYFRLILKIKKLFN